LPRRGSIAIEEWQLNPLLKIQAFFCAPPTRNGGSLIPFLGSGEDVPPADLNVESPES
jgi:hypothetical protein